MKYQQELQRLLLTDPLRMQALCAVRELQLPDAWIGAGLVRDAVWDHLHGYGQRPVTGDVDVVWFDAQRCDPALDSQLQHQLNQLSPGFDWSVKNQARMHLRNGDAPYLSTQHALSYWPETVTAVAVRLTDAGHIEVIAPFGLDDLFELRLRPGPGFEGEKRGIFRERVVGKRWVERYPLLEVIPSC